MPEEVRVVRADLCVVGAGIAGMNALYVASEYLRPEQRVVLVDRNERVGGMWNDTYDYVRLHQPHPFFTAGDVRWTFGKPADHLASKAEVLDHFLHCLQEVRRSTTVIEMFGHELVGAEEQGDEVVVSCRAADGAAVQVVADRMINATGFAISANTPLPLSSTRVRSVAPETCDVRTGEIASDDAPVWVIGSGKTGMDAVHALVTHDPGREVNLLAGTGTFFVERDRLYPTGAARWWRGTRPNALLAGAAERFDGRNEADVLAWLRDNFGTWATPTAEHHVLGMLSRAETGRIRAGLGQVVMDHLVDAVDVEGGDCVRLELRSGSHLDIEPGSWIVNCTGHFAFQGRPADPPYVSESGRVVTVGITPMFGFSSFGAYFLTHLLFLDKITSVPLYTTDGVRLFNANQTVSVLNALVMAQYNLGLVLDHVPAKVFAGCGLDFDRWYPLPRRLAGQLGFMATHRRRREQYRRVLDTVGERFGIRGGPLVGV